MTGLRIAVVKPDWNIRGGFELVVDRLTAHMTAAGHDVRTLSFDAWKSDHRPFGRRIPDEAWASAPELFTFMSQVESAKRIDAHLADVVISTQPPSYVVDHPRHLSLFFHPARMFYELSPYFVQGGFVDPVVHAAATTAVRRIDDEALGRVRHIAAGSETVAERLRTFSGRCDGVSVFHAGPSVERNHARSEEIGTHVLCVSRHDFPKRTELFVHAAHLAPELRAVSVGTGSRLGMLRRLDQALASGPVPERIIDTELWLHNRPWVDPSSVAVTDQSNVEFAGAVDDDALAEFYRGAICVVAPALLEDYGLTVIEAMSYGKPVVVCDDGGHLGALVEDGVTGLVVEPTGRAIADAMRRLAADPGLGASMGANGREVAARFTWSRAFAEFDAAIEQVAP